MDLEDVLPQHFKIAWTEVAVDIEISVSFIGEKFKIPIGLIIYQISTAQIH